jgi:hypothetical protein
VTAIILGGIAPVVSKQKRSGRHLPDGHNAPAKGGRLWVLNREVGGRTNPTTIQETVIVNKRDPRSRGLVHAPEAGWRESLYRFADDPKTGDLASRDVFSDDSLGCVRAAVFDDQHRPRDICRVLRD